MVFCGFIEKYPPIHSAALRTSFTLGGSSCLIGICGYVSSSMGLVLIFFVSIESISSCLFLEMVIICGKSSPVYLWDKGGCLFHVIFILGAECSDQFAFFQNGEESEYNICRNG